MCSTQEICSRHSALAGKLNIGEVEDAIAEGNGKAPSPIPLKGGEWNDMLLVWELFLMVTTLPLKGA